MSNYILKRTDPANPSIVLQQYTVNGPATPASSQLYTNPLSGLSAVNASTSLVLTGKGVPEYGELVQNNLIYLMENFAGPTRPRNVLQGQFWYKNTSVADSIHPTDPTTQGIYCWSGSSWTPILTSTGISGGDLDMNGARIVNLANPSDPDDAVSLSFADGRYVKLAGGSSVAGLTTFVSVVASGAEVSDLSATNATITGPTLLNDLDVSGEAIFAGTSVTVESTTSLVVEKVPLSPLDATNKQYVDAAISSAISGGTANFLPITGGTLTGSTTVGGTATQFAIDPDVAFAVAGGNGLVTFGNRIIHSVGSPLSPFDAATKEYVDAAVTGGGGGGNPFVVSGTFDSSNGNLTLTQSDATTTVVSGTMAARVHTHTDSQLTYVMPLASQSFLTPAVLSSNGTFPTASFTTVLRSLDQGMWLARAPIQRHVINGAPIASPYTVPPNCAFLVGENRLEIFKDGVKLVKSERGNSRVTFTAPGIGQMTSTGLTAGTYNQTVTINGTTATFATVIGAGGMTYRELMNRLNFIFRGSPTTGTGATSGRIDYSWTNLMSNIPTGLANDGTAYTATITVDGVAVPISIIGSSAQTYLELIPQLNAALGTSGTAIIQTATNLRIVSSTTGITSTVALADTNLFSTLTGAGTPVATGGAAAIPPAPTTTVYDATARIEQYAGRITLVIESPTQGTGSSIVTSYASGELIRSIAAGAAPVDTAVLTNRDYTETGVVGATSSIVAFTTPGSGTYEFITHP